MSVTLNENLRSDRSQSTPENVSSLISAKFLFSNSGFDDYTILAFQTKTEAAVQALRKVSILIISRWRFHSFKVSGKK